MSECVEAPLSSLDGFVEEKNRFEVIVEDRVAKTGHILTHLFKNVVFLKSGPVFYEQNS